MLHPIEIELDRVRELRVRWAGGTTSVIPLARLRAACPCALCRERRTPQPIDRNPSAVATAAELVGQYAVRILWQDGHDAGIYDYELIYALGCDATQQ